MRFAVIGDPVSHSLSPAMHGAAHRELGLDHTYEAIRVASGDVGATLDGLRAEGYRGVNVTVPLKEEAMAWAQPDDFAKRVRAVNTIDLRSRQGINTDGPGFVASIAALVGPGDRVLIVGAGGSSRALVAACSDAGFRVDIWNRTAPKAESLAAEIGGQACAHPRFEDYGVVVNATSASLAGTYPEALPLPKGVDQPGLAIDLYYSPSPTPFQSAFADAGWPTRDGRELLVAQGALAFEFWLGVPAPVGAMRSAVGL